MFENYDSDIRDRIRIEKSFKESINVNQNVSDISSEKFRRQPEPVVISYVLLIFITSFAVKLFIQFRKNEKKIDEALKTKIVTEQNFLKQQVNPHFLFNSLNSIYSLANRKSVKTSEAVVKLSDILRYMIYDSQQDKVLLAREINNIRSFIEFQKLRLTGKTKIKFIVDFNPENDLEIEPLLLISMVENAFKYGADNFTESFINLNIKVKDRILYFKVKNRIVHEPQDKGEISGIGLKNVKKRLESLYAGKYELNIIKDEHIFNLSLKLNLEKNNFIWR